MGLAQLGQQLAKQDALSGLASAQNAHHWKQLQPLFEQGQQGSFALVGHESTVSSTSDSCKFW